MGGDGVGARSSGEGARGVAGDGGSGHAGVVRVVAGLLPDRLPAPWFSPVVSLLVSLSFPVSISLPVAVSVSLPVAFSVSVPLSLVLSLRVSFSVPVAFSFPVAVSVTLPVSVPVAVSVTVSVPLPAIPHAFSLVVSASVSMMPGEGVRGARGVMVAGGSRGAPSGFPLIAPLSSFTFPVLLPRLRRRLKCNTPAVHGRPPVPRRPARALPVPGPPPVPLVPQEGLVHPHPGVAIVTPSLLSIQAVRDILPQTHVTLTSVLPAASLLLPPAGGAPRASLGRVNIAILGIWKP